MRYMRTAALALAMTGVSGLTGFGPAYAGSRSAPAAKLSVRVTSGRPSGSYIDQWVTFRTVVRDGTRPASGVVQYWLGDKKVGSPETLDPSGVAARPIRLTELGPSTVTAHFQGVPGRALGSTTQDVSPLPTSPPVLGDAGYGGRVCVRPGYPVIRPGAEPQGSVTFAVVGETSGAPSETLQGQLGSVRGAYSYGKWCSAGYTLPVGTYEVTDSTFTSTDPGQASSETTTPYTFAVGRAATGVVRFGGSPRPVLTGGRLRLIAFVARAGSGAVLPTGTVTFTVGHKIVCGPVPVHTSLLFYNGTSCVTRFWHAGTFDVVVTYAGDDFYQDASGGPVAFTVNPRHP